MNTSFVENIVSDFNKESETLVMTNLSQINMSILHKLMDNEIDKLINNKYHRNRLRYFKDIGEEDY
jgi:hypothetical protein